MIKNDNIILSQSITKDLGLYIIDDQLYEVDFCPYQVYRKHIDNSYPHTDTKGTISGRYGETHLLGSSAKGQSQETLPLLKNGKKSVGHERIDIQIQRLYGYMKALGMSWGELNTQVPLIAKYKDHVWIRGEMDIFPVTVFGQASIVDTKFTKSVHNIFSSIKEEHIRHSTMACWGNFDDVVKNQPIMYHWLSRHFKDTGIDNLIKFNQESEAKYRHLFSQSIDFNDVNFYFLVAGYDVKDISDELRHFEYAWNKQRAILFEYLIEKAIERIREAMDAEWKPNPKEHLCRSCALKNECLK